MDFNILSFGEEQKLSNKELINYYSRLRDYLKNTDHEGLSKGSLTICPYINPLVRKVLNNYCGYDIETRYDSDINGLDGIYAHTHQSKMDHVNIIATNPNHTILLNSIILSELYKMVLRINGVYFVDKNSKGSKAKSKLEMIRLLLDDRSITMFPESAWCLSPNKLHLPFYIGIVDIAKKTGKPIIPAVQEYIYDESKLDGKERIKKVIVRYGNPIYVSETDNIFEKLEEYSEWISTARWKLISEKGLISRTDVNNDLYINYLKGNIRNLKNAGIDINVERNGLFGANDDFYLFHHINDIAFNESGELLPTELVRKLEKISKNHFRK